MVRDMGRLTADVRDDGVDSVDVVVTIWGLFVVGIYRFLRFRMCYIVHIFGGFHYYSASYVFRYILKPSMRRWRLE